LAKMESVTVMIGEDLDLDVTSAGEEGLEVDSPAAEHSLPEPGGGGVGALEPRRIVQDGHADPAAPGGRLEDDGIAQLVADQGDAGAARPYEREAGFLDPPHEFGVLGEEAVARVDGIAAGGARDL